MAQINLIKYVAAALLCAACVPTAQAAQFDQEPACQTLQPASAGGPLPKSPDVLVLRYFSYGNYEVAYRAKVLLLDAFYDNSRSPLAAPVGLKESDITRADAILIGHTHLDHFADAPAVAKRTGAPVFLGPPGLGYVKAHGLAEKQIHVVRGGETIQQPGYTIQTALGIHMTTPPDASKAYAEFLKKSSPLTAEQQKQFSDWLTPIARAATVDEDPLDPDRDTIYHGTIVYVVTFDSGFRLVYSDTAGVLSGGERALSDSIHAGGGKIDLAILGYLDGGFSLRRAIQSVVTRVKVWQPGILLPSHFHDGDLLYPNPMPEMPTAPLFEALRDQVPNTRGIGPLYSSPVCVNTKTGEFRSGNYVH
ncbi:MAG: MBL fold metallo-hydrolase [Bryobacteraceae bacterium]